MEGGVKNTDLGQYCGGLQPQACTMLTGCVHVGAAVARLTVAVWEAE